MTIPHLDPCLNPQRYQQTHVTLPYTNRDGEYTLNAINVFEENFRNSILQETSRNPLTVAVNRYGNDVFYESVNQLNNDFLQRPYIIERIPSYPVLSERLVGGRVTPFEFAQFINDYSYSPTTAFDSYNSNGPRFLQELNDFYTGSFASSVLGGFCSLMPNIFAAIGGFFSLIGKVQGLIQDALSFINKIKNIEDPIKALFEKIKVTALIEAIKEKITKAVEGIINKVKNVIENFNIADVVNQVKTFVKNNITKRIATLKESIAAFFTEENMKSIVDKVKGLIDYAIGLFENPNIEEIQFLIARFCGFAAGIEGLLNGLRAPLDDFSNRYLEVFNTLQNASNRIVGESIRAGAVRYPPEVREEQINTARVQWELAGNIAPVTTEEIKDLPQWQGLLDGRYSDKLQIVGARWVTNELMKPNNEGWDNMDIYFRCLIMRLQKEAKNTGIISGHLLLNSGYRNPRYNEFVGGAKKSNHMSGVAADISWTGGKYGSSSNREALIEMAQLARRVGITGRGFYDSFLHIAMSQENFSRRSDITV